MSNTSTNMASISPTFSSIVTCTSCFDHFDSYLCIVYSHGVHPSSPHTSYINQMTRGGTRCPKKDPADGITLHNPTEILPQLQNLTRGKSDRLEQSCPLLKKKSFFFSIGRTSFKSVYCRYFIYFRGEVISISYFLNL